MPSADKNQEGGPGSSRTETVFLVLLLLTTFLSAFCAYQAHSWSGIQSAKYQEATEFRTEAVRAYNDANTQLLIDLDIFLTWADAVGQNDTVRARAIANRFTPEFRPAFAAWVSKAPDYPQGTLPNATPFALPEYRLSARERGDRLEEHAAAAFAAAQYADEISTRYLLTTLIYAIVLFLCGVGEEWRDRRLRTIILGTAVLFFCSAAALLLWLPKTF